MKFTFVLALSASLMAPTAFAGGPVVVLEQDEVVSEKPAASGGLLPLLLVPILLCIALCDSDDEVQTPP